MPSTLSLRSDRALAPRPYYWDQVPEAMQDPWSPENPDGFIMAAVAENGASDHIILDRLNSHSSASTAPVDVLKYGDPKGSFSFRERLCELLERTIMQGMDVAPENMIISSGIGSVLDNLFFCLADEGASCLIPAPYYPMFDLDLGARDGVEAVPVDLGALHDVITALDAAVLAQERKRRPVKAVLITNPDNPTGKIMAEERLKQIMLWCHRKRIHCVVDEAYALSVFPSEAHVRSAIVVAAEAAADLPPSQAAKLWDYVHVLWGLSKDLCASGLRIGTLYTYNAALLEAYGNIAALSAPSYLTQWQLEELLADTAFVDTYLRKNVKLLRKHAQIVTSGLERMQVAFELPQAGFFVWASFKDRLGIESFEREREIYHAIFETAKVFLVPGQACHATEPGHFRICYASHPEEAVHDMMARLQHFVDQYRVKNAAQSWNTQSYMIPAGFGTR